MIFQKEESSGEINNISTDKYIKCVLGHNIYFILKIFEKC